MNKFYILITTFLLMLSCNNNKERSDSGKTKNIKKKDPQTKIIIKKKATKPISCETIFQRHGKCFLPNHKIVFNIPIKDSAKKGVKAPLVTIIEFSDMECPGCRAWATQIFPKLLKKYPNEIQMVFKHFPLDFHTFANLAAQALEEIKLQKGDKAFWKFHDFLYKNQDSYSIDFLMAKLPKSKKKDPASIELKKKVQLIISFLKSLKIDLKKYRKALASGVHKKKIDSDIKTANQIKVNQTPRIYINGTMLRNNENIDEIVELNIKKAKKLIKSGIKPEDLYLHYVKGDLIQRKLYTKVQLAKMQNKFKKIFIPQCKTSPKIKPVIEAMRKCSAKNIECKPFEKCVNNLLENAR